MEEEKIKQENKCLLDEIERFKKEIMVIKKKQQFDEIGRN
jgi:hypothetical protein